jgi:hypothetical protein
VQILLAECAVWRHQKETGGEHKLQAGERSQTTERKPCAVCAEDIYLLARRFQPK